MKTPNNNNYLKLTIIKLIDQCAYRCIINDKPAFYNLCESAWEWAWNALGIEENYIYAEDFYALYDKVWADQKMLDFLLVRSENLYKQGKLTGFCILGDNDVSLVGNWIFAIHSELKQLKT
jgi:hypothetical protein